MWTNYGYRDGHKWAIHHLDEDKLNNSLTNLCFLTRPEHNRLHMKGKKIRLGRHPSEETRRRLSESHKGNKNPNFGKHFSEETCKKMSKSKKGMNTWTKGLRWFNDGIKNYRCKDCPPGCVKGCLKINRNKRKLDCVYKNHFEESKK